MPTKKKPLLQPGRHYHIYNRGNNRRTIFYDEQDYLRFLSLIRKYISPAMKVYTYALLPDHFHVAVEVRPIDQLPPLFIERPRTINNSAGHLQNAYAKYFLYKYRKTEISGLFEHRFERKPITSQRQLVNTIHYVNFNGHHHGYVSDPHDYLYTSLQELLCPTVESFVDREAVYRLFGDEVEFRRATKEALAKKLVIDPDYY